MKNILHTFNWFGTDVSNEVSLFEYGFLMRWNSKAKEYDVIYGIPIGEETYPYKIIWSFSYERFDADWWRNEIKENKELLQGIADMCGFGEDEYLDETNDVNMLNDLLHYYGGMELGFGDYGKRYTESEIRRRLNKALKS